MDLKPSIGFACLSAALYLIPVLYFVLEDNYTNAYFLYIGNALFAIGIVAGELYYNRQRKENALATALITNSMKTALIGIAIILVLLLIILLFDIPHLFSGSGAGKEMANAPANSVHDSTNGMKMMLFLDDLLGNFMVSSLIAVLFAFSSKKDQTGTTAEKNGREAGEVHG